jgi:hypothetical protein
VGPRAGFSTVLILGAVVLLLAIEVGNNMGNRVLGQVASRVPAVTTTPVVLPSPSPGDQQNQLGWNRRQVVSVATDPAFPDPRVTPEPPPPPAPRLTPKPTPKPVVTSSSAGDIYDSPTPLYTSPPMPIPLVTHEAGETSPPDGEGDVTPSPLPSPSAKPRPRGDRAGFVTPLPNALGTLSP